MIRQKPRQLSFHLSIAQLLNAAIRRATNRQQDDPKNIDLYLYCTSGQLERRNMESLKFYQANA